MIDYNHSVWHIRSPRENVRSLPYRTRGVASGVEEAFQAWTLRAGAR